MGLGAQGSDDVCSPVLTANELVKEEERLMRAVFVHIGVSDGDRAVLYEDGNAPPHDTGICVVVGRDWRPHGRFW